MLWGSEAKNTYTHHSPSNPLLSWSWFNQLCMLEGKHVAGTQVGIWNTVWFQWTLLRLTLLQQPLQMSKITTPNAQTRARRPEGPRLMLVHDDDKSDCWWLLFPIMNHYFTIGLWTTGSTVTSHMIILIWSGTCHLSRKNYPPVDSRRGR